jgi:predicted O-linked N-acetylglucosamine transferase (SPINDLY family)
MFLDAPDVILWWFYQVPTYMDYTKEKLDKYRETLVKLLDMGNELITDTIRFNQQTTHLTLPINSKKCLQIMSRGSTYYYNICYTGYSNSNIISKFNILLDNFTPTLKYISPLVKKNHDTTNKIYKINDIKIQYLLELWNNEQTSNLTLKETSLLNSLAQETDVLSIKKQIRRIKIIFITNKFLNYTSVFRDRIGIIHNLDKRYFDVHIGLFTNKNSSNYKTKLINKIYSVPVLKKYLDNFIKNEKVVILDNIYLQHNQSILEESGFHIIFYPDIGMMQSQTLLAHSRLAPIQCVTWGHSDTSGISRDIMDYYITSQYFEKIDNLDVVRSNYTEKAILLPSLGTYYYSPRKIVDTYFKPNFESFMLNKSGFGFPDDAIVIGCLQSFYKFNDEFEHVLGMIMERISRIPNKKIYLALSNSFPFNKLHLARIEKYLGKYKANIKWFQNLAPPEWLNLISICHIMIDPFPFGGCNTTLEAFDYSIPVVCMPSDVINGRFTLGFINKIEEVVGDEQGIISKCLVASSVSEYVGLVVRLVQDGTRYKYLQNMIRKGVNGLFEDSESLHDYNHMFIDLVKKHMV